MSVDAVSALERGVRRAPHNSTLDLLIAALELVPGDALELKQTASRARARGSETLAAAPPGSNLQHPASSFIGRRSETAEVGRLITDENCRIVTITGPGGVGKSRLALESVKQIAGNDGWIVSLATVADSSRVAGTIAKALRIAVGAEESASDALQRALRASESIVIIDNCEHVLDSVARIITDIIASSPHIRIVATSRERLRINGEVVFVLSPLPCPAKMVSDASTARSFPAVELFVQRGAPFLPDLATLRDADVPAICDIVRQLDGLPLAIELVAPMVRLFGIAGLGGRLRERLRMPLLGNRDAPEHHRTIEGIVDWSYQRLTEGERAVFEACAVFAGTFTLEAVLDVCSTDSTSDDDTLVAFAALIDKSLVTVADASRTRYLLLETIRAYAITAARRSMHFEELLSRFASHYVAVVEGLEMPLSGSDRINNVNRMKDDRHNIEAALAWSLDTASDVPIGARLALGAASLFEDEAFSTSRHWFDRARLLIDSKSHPDLWSKITIAAQIYLQYRADWVDELPEVERAVDIMRRLGTPREIANGLLWLAALHGSAGDQQRCDDAGAEAVAFARREDPRFLSHMLHVTAGLMADSDFVRRRSQIEEGLRIYTPDVPAANWANSYANLSEAQYLSGDVDAARKSARRAVEIADRIENNDVIRVAVFSVFASLALLADDVPEGHAAARRAVTVAAGIHDPGFGAIALQEFAYALALSGDLQRAAMLAGFVDRRLSNNKVNDSPASSRECRARLARLLIADEFRELEHRGANWTVDQAIECALTSPQT